MVQVCNPSTWKVAQDLVRANKQALNSPDTVSDRFPEHVSHEQLLASAESAVQAGLTMALHFRVLTASHSREQEC